MKRNKKSIFVEWLLKTKRHLRSKAPAWCESSGQAALFYSLPDEQINTAKLSSCKVPHEPFSGGSCTPDGGERPTFFISFLSLNFIKSTSASLAPIWCYGIVLMCHNGQSVCAVGEANLSASMIGCANGAYALLREGRASDPSRVKDHYTLAIKEKSDTQGRSPVSRQARSATFSLTRYGFARFLLADY